MITIMSTLLFFLKIVLAFAVLFVIQLPARRTGTRLLHAAVFILKLLLIPGIALLFVAIESALAYQHGELLCAVYVALIGDSAADAVEFLFRRIHRSREGKGGRSCSRKTFAVLGLVICLALTAYGYVNSQRIVRNVHEWRADGLKREHTFAFVSDVHAGSAQPVEKLHGLCRRINESKPEFVILGGDVTDEFTTLEDMESAYEILSEIEAPTYFIYGNHDRQPGSDYVGGRTYSDKQLTEAIFGAGMTILQDEYVKISDDLMLLGREDLSRDGVRKGWTDLRDQDLGECALVVADHAPYDNGQLLEEGSALQISGHTHAGQLWPLQIIYRILGYQAYGEFHYPGTLLYVSAGVSGWKTPLRTEERCEWDLITLKP